ncbi:hypothetical protein J3U57_04215 [Gilliamella sp. B3464]|uniref:hypothetical protein n=2 Tax=Gilliamella TaxID=1193503 RepID=UPI00226AE07E|nr:MULTISPECIES: hypothetical protein [unclassified Gilliamella]MCX8711729.1 hypothetical protein [Gilliamella sp. B3468]MCX8727782.1 hypothetical protein [Gilliamella sp. B2838]MCX8750779.1 hypothetical protein [Gilliamella sp. B3464]
MKRKLIFLFFINFKFNIFNQLIWHLIFKRINPSNKVIHLKLNSTLSIIGIHFLFILFSPYTEALSNVTAKTIVGSAPYLQLKSDQDGNVGTKIKGLNELLGFRMPTTENNNALKFVDVSESISFGGKPLQVPEGTKFSDIITMVPANGQASALSQFNVGDDDGDASLTENTTIEGTLTATWYDNNNVITDLSRELNVCGGPYFLKMGAQNVAVSTKYGQPNKNIYGSQPVITYQFMLDGGPKLCFVQPNMNVYKNSSYMTKYPNGYNPEVWDPGTSPSSNNLQQGGGFKAEQFKPITGFKDAAFMLIGSGADQSLYRCQLDSSNSTNWVTLQSPVASKDLGANCQVRYDSVTKPTTPLTINMEYSADKGKTWQNIGKITLPIPQKWAIIPTKVKGFLDIFDGYLAYDECRRIIDGQAIPKTTSAQVNDMSEAGKAWRQKYLYRRDELTNSLQANTPEWTANASVDSNKYPAARDLGTFMSEWGGPYYFGTYLWTAEMYRTNKPFAVIDYGLLGSVKDDGFDLGQGQSAQIFCRGENGISTLPTR